MTPEVLTWDDTSNNKFLIEGKGSLICNPISAYRKAESENRNRASSAISRW